MKVLLAGFHHETNSFSPGLTTWEAFSESGGKLPAVSGEKARAALTGAAVGAGGFIESAEARGWELKFGLWCNAEPSGLIAREAFEHICDQIVGACEDQTQAVYLCLHGAAMAQGFDDAEGELLTRVRARVGPSIPIVASLDCHANVTDTMLYVADALVAYRTHPHVDQPETGKRAAELLSRRLARGSREPFASWRLPYLISASAQPTTREPARRIYRRVAEIDDLQGTISTFCMAFPASDFPGCAPIAWSYGERSDKALELLRSEVEDPAQWRCEAVPVRDVLDRAMARASQSSRPVVLADTQDNPGAGGTGNTTGFLHALLEKGVGKKFPAKVAVAIMFDPDAAAKAIRAGVGKEVNLSLGRSVQVFDGWSEPALEGSFLVKATSAGNVTYGGPQNAGFKATLGPSVCLEIEGVLIVVASERVAATDREQFRMVGIDPEEMKIVVVKSSNHFRADFEPLTEDPDTDVIVVKAKGAFAVDPRDLPWKNLSPSTRTSP